MKYISPGSGQMKAGEGKEMLLNRARATEVMERHQLDALVAALPINVMYLSDFPNDYAFQFGSRMFAVFPRNPDRPATLVLPESRLNDLAVYPTWVPVVRTFGAMHRNMSDRQILGAEQARLYDLLDETRKTKQRNWLDALTTALREHGLAGGRLGIDLMNPVATIRGAGIDAEFVNAEETFREIRAVKTPQEIERIATASRINEQAEQEAIAALRPGVNWLHVKAVFDAGTAKRGAQPRFWTSGGGLYASATFHASDYTLNAGDIVRFDCGGAYEGYCSDTGRVAVLGRVTDKMRSLWSALRSGMEDAEETIRPGVPGSAVFHAAVEAVRKAGIPEYQRHGTGHGIGLEQYDRPIVSGSEPMVLEPGMVLNVEVPYYELGWGGLQLEDTFVVTKGGCERLTHLTREIFAV